MELGNNGNSPNRRSFLKGLATTTVGATGFSGIAAASDGCDTHDLPLPDDTDFAVNIWRTEAAANNMYDKISFGEIIDYLDKEYSKVDFFDVNFYDGYVKKASTFKNETTADEDYPMWPFGDWIQDNYYGGDWTGEQGQIDILYYHADNWSDGDRNNGAAPSSGAAYNGAHINDRRNPAPIAMVRADNADKVGLKCRAKHELAHLFFPEGPDENGYAVDDHAVMDLDDTCLPLNDTSVSFIEFAYEYGQVYPWAPDSVYTCQP